MPNRVRRGDFLVPEEDVERAEAVFEERSRRSRKQDRAFRAPLTTDVELYEHLEGRGLDYPGVDTPTDDPRESMMDFIHPSDFEAAYGEGGVAVDPQEEGAGEALAFGLRETGSQGRHLLDAIAGRE